LRDHEMTHTGKKAFHCEICGKGYIQKPQWKAHMKSHGIEEK
jgi:hypothetical protein